MRALRSLAALLVLASFAFADDTSSSSTKRIFYKVTSDKGEVYLLGSVHMGDEDMQIPKEIDDAFKKSVALAIECDPAEAQTPELGELVMKKMRYEAGDSLEKHLSKETLEALEKWCQKTGGSFDEIKKMRPWMVSLSIAMAGYQKAGMKAENGIDNRYINRAKKRDKKIVSLEKAEDQINLIADMPEDLIDEGIRQSLAEEGKTKEKIQALLSAWKTGDAKKLYAVAAEELEKSPKSKPFWKRMVDDRNEKMAEKIEGFLGEKGPYFVCVGAMHVVGDKGIVKLLEAKKFKVEQVTVTPPAKEKAAAKEPEKEGAGAK